jgi:hypothetical protein
MASDGTRPVGFAFIFKAVKINNKAQQINHLLRSYTNKQHAIK